MTDPLIPFVDDLAPDVDLQKRMRDAQRLRVWRSLTDNYGKDPNKPAQAFNAKLGPYVDDYIAQQEKMRRELVQATNRTALSPAASEWLSNPDYSRMSWDDVDRLVDLDRGVSQIAKSILGFPTYIIQSLTAGSYGLLGDSASFVGGLVEQAIEIARTSGYSAPGFQKMLLEDLARQGFTSREIARVRQQITPPTQEEFISEGGIAAGISSSAKALKEFGFATSTFGSQIVTPLSTPIKEFLGRGGVDPNSAYGSILSGVQSIPAMVAFLPFYVAFGVHAGSVAFVLPVYGNALLQAENKGITGQTAHTYALGSAGIEYLTNIIPAGKFLADMKLGSALLQRIKNQLPTEYVQENLATAFQDLLDMGVLYPEKTFEEYLRERPERAWHTILATTAGVVGLNSTIRISERLSGSLDLQQKRTRANDAIITAIKEQLKDSKLQERSPKLAGLYADTSLRQHGLDRARIDAETLNQILEESGLREEFLQDFPGVAEQLNQNGTDPGTDVDMSTGAYASQVALNEKYADIASRMQPHLRLGSAEFSLAEESQIEAERQRIKKDAEDLARKQIEDAEENANQRQVILKELADFAAQMPGIRKKQASAAAEIAVTSWENLAKANNMKVGELWELMKPVLVAGDITIPEMSGKGILFQDMTPEQESAYNKALEEDNIAEAQRIFDESLIAADTHFTKKHTVFPAHIMGPWGRGPGRLMAEDPNLAYRKTSRSQIDDMLSSGLVRARDVTKMHPSKRDSHRFVTVYYTRGTPNMSYRASGLPGRYIIVAPSSIDEMSGGLPVSQVEQIWYSDGEQWTDVTEEIKPKFVVTGRPRRGQAGARVTSEQDAAYMEAVESGDTQAQQAAVDQAAEAAGYTVELYHGTTRDFDTFERGSHFGSRRDAAIDRLDFVGAPQESRRVVRVRANLQNTIRLEDGEVNSLPRLLRAVRDGKYPELAEAANRQDIYSVQDLIDAAGFDSAVYENNIEDRGVDSYLIVDPSRVKSAEAITRDADGNVIPLSQRFDVTQPSILYAPEADAGRRGAYEPRSMRIILTQKADATTLVHEFTHHYLHSLSILAHNKDAPEAITTQFQTLLDWFGVADVAAWDALPTEQKAAHHEALTYNFEQFIGTGKAPTKRLRDVFKRVAAWMRKIYGDIRGELNAAYRKEFGKDLPALTPEVREVFEAMLGAESNTAEAAAELNFNPVFQSQEESGMNDEEWEAYNLGAELIIDEATSTLTASTARAMRWLDGAMARVIRAKTKQAKKERKAIRDRIKTEVEQQPVYRVMNMLRRGVVIEEDGTERKVDGQHRLNAEAVRQMFPEDANDPGYLDLSSLRAGRYGMIAKDGIDPAVVADQFGYDSAAQMIRDLVAARPINDVINERTNKEIEKRHPELSPAAIKQAAMESLHNDAMSKFVATELRFLAGIQKPTRVIAEAARREAEAKIASLPYRSLVPSKFLTAERRAARVADQWMRSGDRVATAAQRKALTEARKALREAEAVGDAVAISDATLAVQQAQAELQQARDELADQPGRATVDAVVRAKWNQLYQGMLYREAVAARKKFDKHRRYLRRIAKDSKRKKILPEYADQIDYVLRRLNISGVSRRTAEQMSVDRAKFLSWLEEQTDQNIEYSMSEGDLNLVAQRPIEDIPMESLDAIVDTIESIYHRGFVIRNGAVMQQKRRIGEAEEDIVGEINEHAGKERPKNTTPATVLGRVQKSLYTFFNQHIKTAARARVIGGGKHGVFWNLFIRPANNQAAAEEQMIADFSQRTEGILQPFYERGPGTMDSGKTMARRKFNKSTGAWENDPTRPPRSLTHEEVFVLALNLGNESNIQRVVDGFGITIEEARDITSSLSAGELRAVQQIWDLFAELKPQISAMERRLYGKEPKWLTPAPIALQSSDGTTVELSGGYFPIKYDRSASELGMKIEAANEARAQLQGAFMGTQTRDSYKKTRADRVFGKPLLLQTSTLFNGLTEIVHDLSWREYIVDFNLLMPSDGAIPRAIIERYGAEWMQDIRQWVKDIAAAGPGPVHASEAWMQALRRSISISRLGFNPITGLLQGTGLVVTAQHTGAKHVADAMSKFMGDMDSARKEAIDKSPGMRNRFRTQFRELGEQAARIRGKSTWVMSLERAGYWGIITLQSAVDTITWHAGYSRAFEDNPNISEEEAAARAYQTVFDTQGSGNIINLSTIERGGPASQLLTVFYSWQNALFNELYVIAKTEGLSDKGVFRLATLAVLLPFLTVAIRDIVPDDEEERRKRRTGKGAMTLGEQYLWATLKESINTIGGTMVGVREIAPTIASILSGERAFEYRGPTGFAPITDFIGTVRAGAESGIMSKRFAKQGMYFAGDILRLPSTQINRMIDGIDAMVEGKDVPWWAVVLGTQK